VKHQTVPSFYVAGLAVRTSNSVESAGNGKIPELWGQFMQKDPALFLPGKLGDEIYAVYTDYEGDHRGDYTCVIGYKVSFADNLPAEVTAVEIPSGNYAILNCDQGPVTEVIPAIWRQIWALSHEELNGTRSFKADFELYDHRSLNNPALAQIDVYLGLR
jgi:predicted transcriptional regulator YdeE